MPRSCGVSGCLKPNGRRYATVSCAVYLEDHFATWRALPGEYLAEIAARDADQIGEFVLAKSELIDVYAKCFHALTFAHSKRKGKIKCLHTASVSKRLVVASCKP